MAMVAIAVLVFAHPAGGQVFDPEEPPIFVPGEPVPIPGSLPPGDWTAEQQAAMLDLIARTEAVLPQFADSTTLEALGFYNFGISAPGGYDHWINPGWFDDGHLLDPNFPESLVFQYTADGYELVAAMFFMPTGTTMDNIPEGYAWWPGFHSHPELCVNDEGKFASLANSDGTCPSGHPNHFPVMMHTWIVDTECGHRFGGVDTFGLHCDVHGHPGGHPPGHDPVHDPGHDPGHQPGGDPGPDPGHDHGQDPPPAPPVHVHPTFTG
jgi:hypothetical protein